MLKSVEKSVWLLVAASFALCVAPTFISYQPYLFEWDDSTYLGQAIEVSRAFWFGDIHGMGAMGGVRPPAMALMGMPWGPLGSWDAAGKCFISLAAVISLLAALCLYLMLRTGVNPLFLVAASVCTFASIGPYPRSQSDLSFVEHAACAHCGTTAFMADSLLAWTALAAVLLIPYEAASCRSSGRSALMRGLLWGSILSLGVMTKLSFLYFIACIVPTVFVIRLYRAGLRSAHTAFGAFLCCSAPVAFYLARWGRPAFENAKASSFGGVAGFYYIPLFQFLGMVVRESPGVVLSLSLAAIALVYVIVRKRMIPREPEFLAILILIGFGAISLSAPNRQIRYALPAIVALPFLSAIILSGKVNPVTGRSAIVPAGVAFCCLVLAAVPTRHRPNRESILRSEAVLAEATRCNAKGIELATDSPTLNQALMKVAIDTSGLNSLQKTVRVNTLAYNAISGIPIEDDIHTMREADQVVFQDKDQLSPPFTNQRVSDYERYVRQAGYIPARVASDLTVYSMSCRP